MPTVTTLETIKAFLEERVSSRIELQQPNDDNVQEYSLANPNVFKGWIPPNGYLPAGMESAIPCLVVGMDEAGDDGEQETTKIRISAVVYSPGLHEPDGEAVTYTPDFQGYNDLLNLIDLTTAQLRKNRIINGQLTVELPVKWGMYQEQPYPYWYGWITFDVRTAPYPVSELAKNYL